MTKLASLEGGGGGCGVATEDGSYADSICKRIRLLDRKTQLAIRHARLPSLLSASHRIGWLHFKSPPNLLSYTQLPQFPFHPPPLLSSSLPPPPPPPKKKKRKRSSRLAASHFDATLLKVQKKRDKTKLPLRVLDFDFFLFLHGLIWERQSFMPTWDVKL